MDVSCKACGELVPLKNIDMRLLVARCDGCDVVFSAEKQLDQKTELEDGSLIFPLRDSDAIDVARFDNDLYITRHWNRPSAITIQVLIGGGILLIVLFALLLTSTDPQNLNSIGFSLLCLLPTWMIFAYFQAANLLNVTKLIVVDGELIMRHEPVPGWPSGSVPAANIAQLFCKAYKNKDGDVTSYNVYLESLNGSRRRLLGGLPNYEQAICIERLLERHLGLDDRPTSMEYDPNE